MPLLIPAAKPLTVITAASLPSTNWVMGCNPTCAQQQGDLSERSYCQCYRNSMGCTSLEIFELQSRSYLTVVVVPNPIVVARILPDRSIFQIQIWRHHWWNKCRVEIPITSSPNMQLQVPSLNCSYSKISNLEGLQYFTALENWMFPGNFLTGWHFLYQNTQSQFTGCSQQPDYPSQLAGLSNLNYLNASSIKLIACCWMLAPISLFWMCLTMHFLNWILPFKHGLNTSTYPTNLPILVP